MWLIVTAGAAICATAAWYLLTVRSRSHGDRLRLSFLCLMLWGATIMWLVDHLWTYLVEGGPFLELSPDAALLGLSVLGLAIAIWAVAVIAGRSRNKAA